MRPTTAASSGRAKSQTPEQANAEVLLWQSRIRIGAALAFGAIGITIMAVEPTRPSALVGIGVLASYVSAILALCAVARRTGEARRDLVLATIACDVLFIFALTYVASPAESYGRALIAGFGILHLTEFYFGRPLAWVTLFGVSASYVALLAIAALDGAPFHWEQAVWSLAVFVLAGGSFVFHYGSFRSRLTSVVALFDRAEEGDFGGEYDADTDPRPDVATMVGKAYNRVRAQLANLVLTDPLSGCLNRRGLEQRLTGEISRAARTGNPLALLAIDVDHFKEINDTFGHLAGDMVVQEVGELLRNVARAGDIVARTGGDEFTLLLPETSAAGAFRLASRIRDRVSKHAFPGLSGRVDVTVSIGLVSDRIEDENVAHDLHSRADEALYAAKGGGRNRVSIWTRQLRAIAGR